MTEIVEPKKPKMFECQFCHKKYPIEEASIQKLIDDLGTHQKMNFLMKKVVRIALEKVIKEKEHLK